MWVVQLPICTECGWSENQPIREQRGFMRDTTGAYVVLKIAPGCISYFLNKNSCIQSTSSSTIVYLVYPVRLPLYIQSTSSSTIVHLVYQFVYHCTIVHLVYLLHQLVYQLVPHFTFLIVLRGRQLCVRFERCLGTRSDSFFSRLIGGIPENVVSCV